MEQNVVALPFGHADLWVRKILPIGKDILKIPKF